jgi:hypothetical protein
MKQEIQQLADSQNATIDFDLTINEELYIRTRIERTATRVKSYYFVRSGDTGESSEGVCPADKFGAFIQELAAAVCISSGHPATANHKLEVNSATKTVQLSAQSLVDVLETLSNYAPDLAILDNFKPFVS